MGAPELKIYSASPPNEPDLDDFNVNTHLFNVRICLYANLFLKEQKAGNVTEWPHNDIKQVLSVNMHKYVVLSEGCMSFERCPVNVFPITHIEQRC